MRRITTLLLAFCFVSVLIPLSALAEDDYITIGGIKLESGMYLGNAALESTSVKPEGMGYAYYENGVLTLDGFVFNDFREEAVAIISEHSLKIVPIGENTINAESSGISVKGETLVFEGAGSLNINAKAAGIIYGSKPQTKGTVTLSFVRGDYKVDSGDDAICVNGMKAYMNVEDVTLTLKSKNFDGLLLSANQYCELNINGGTMNVSGSESYGISLNSWGKAVLNMNGGSVMATPSVTVISIAMSDDNEINMNGGTFICKYLNCAASEIHLGKNIIQKTTEDGMQFFGKVEVDYAVGDINDDGDINQYDYILAKRCHFETITLTEDELLRADVDFNGKVNQYDYILLKRHHFGTYTIIAD